MNKLIRWLMGIDRLEKRIRADSEDDFRATRRRRLGNKCPACLGALDNHLDLLLGQFIADELESVIGWVEARIKCGEWWALDRIDEFYGDRDYVIVYLVRCPVASVTRGVIVLSYAEFYFNDEVLDGANVPATALSQLAVDTRAWKPF
jgi:hypothetical protein